MHRLPLKCSRYFVNILDDADALSKEQLELQRGTYGFELDQLHLQLSVLNGGAKVEQHLKHATGYMNTATKVKPKGLATNSLVDN